MAYASRSGRARVNARDPRAKACCDRCQMWYNHDDLSWQTDWRGTTIQNIRILVCRSCLDVPQEQLRAIVVPADPIPIIQPRVENFTADESDYRTVAQPTVTDPVTGIPIPATTTFVTGQGDNRVTQEVGRPNGVALASIMPAFGKLEYGPTISMIAMFGDGYETVTVTCNVPHGLAQNGIVVVADSVAPSANGTYSVNVISATTFSYQTQNPVPNASVLSGKTKIWTAYVGLPRNMAQYPKTGGATNNPSYNPIAQGGNSSGNSGQNSVPSLDFEYPNNSQYIPVI